MHALVRVALVLLALGATSALHATVPCGGGLSIVHQDRIFDGSRIGVIVFRSARLSFFTDTFGAWVPKGGTADGAILLRHRIATGATVSICIVPQAEAPLTERSWKDYVRALAADTNNSSEVLSSPESTAELSTTSLLGWHTREVLFRRSSAQPGHFTIERELLASDGQHALLFRLTASEADHALATADLDFFIARLELL